jgi:GNAT superfamily N-acetyltransferase
VPALNEYPQRFAEQHRRKGISATYARVDSAAPSEILGCYTLSAAEVDVQSVTEADRKRLPRFPVACFRMGRLACRADRQGQGLGQMLVACAVDRCLKAREQVAAYAAIVDAKDVTAKRFYERFGFKALRDAGLTLYLPLGK